MGRRRQVVRPFVPSEIALLWASDPAGPNERESETECESCLQAGEHVPATTRSTNPRFSGYALCEECAQHYNGEPTNEV